MEWLWACLSHWIVAQSTKGKQSSTNLLCVIFHSFSVSLYHLFTVTHDVDDDCQMMMFRCIQGVVNIALTATQATATGVKLLNEWAINSVSI